MYAQRELTRLAEHKARLRWRIAARRVECTHALTQVLRPVAWLDRAIALWRRFIPFAPLAAVPLGFLFKRAAAPRRSLLSLALRWGPALFGIVRNFTGAARARKE